MGPQPSSSKPCVLNTNQPDQPQGREQSQCTNRYSDDSSLLQPHLRAAWNRIKVVTRMFVWPASTFWMVRTFNSTSSASRSCVIFWRIRSRRIFAPSTLSCCCWSFDGTPY